jgi:hypothetical protein
MIVFVKQQLLASENKDFPTTSKTFSNWVFEPSDTSDRPIAEFTTSHRPTPAVVIPQFDTSGASHSLKKTQGHFENILKIYS